MSALNSLGFPKFASDLRFSPSDRRKPCPSCSSPFRGRAPGIRHFDNQPPFWNKQTFISIQRPLAVSSFLPPNSPEFAHVWLHLLRACFPNCPRFGRPLVLAAENLPADLLSFVSERFALFLEPFVDRPLYFLAVFYRKSGQGRQGQNSGQGKGKGQQGKRRSKSRSNSPDKKRGRQD